MFKGSFTALITPFKNGAVDVKAYQDFVAWQIDEGADGMVPCGTTGESPTLSHKEHHLVVETCIEAVAGRAPVIAGAGSNSTDEAVELTRHAKKAGADAVLIVTPYYNKPTQEGLYRHYKTINDEGDMPIIVYNIPGRSVVDISVKTMERLAKLSNIVGVKDATSDLNRPILTRNACGAGFCQLSGEDGTALPFLSAGGVGCISVTANIAPRMCADMHRAWQEGDLAKAMDLQFKLSPVHSAMFFESSPAPVKYAASLLGKCTAEVRAPLCEVSQAGKRAVEEALESAKILA